MSANEAKAIPNISKHIGHDWKRLGRGLGFSKTELDGIEVANPHVLQDQIDELFIQWKRREGRNASVEQLVVAARTEGLDDLLVRAGLSEISLENALDSMKPIQCQEETVEADKICANPRNMSETPDRAELREKRLRVFDKSASQQQSANQQLSSQQQSANQQLSSQQQSANQQLSSQQQSANQQLSSQQQSVNQQLSSQQQSANQQLSSQQQSANQQLSSQQQSANQQLSSQQQSANQQLSHQQQSANQQQWSSQHQLHSPKESSSSYPECSNACATTQTEVPRLEVGDCCKVDLPDGTCRYGVLMCIMELDINNDGKVQDCAGLVMEDKEDIYMYPGLDGTFREIEYFKCKQGYGLLLPLDVIKHDDRFVTYLAPISTPPTTLKSSGATPHALTAAPQGSPTLATVTPPMVMDRSQSSPSHPLCEPVAMPRKSNTCSESSAPKDVLLKCLLEVFDTTEVEFCFPGDRTGLLIGREGKNVKEVEELTHTKIDIIGDKNDVSQNGTCKITGSKENCNEALFLLLTKVEANINRQTTNKRVETVELAGKKECGLVIGQDGKTLKSIQYLSGANVKIHQDELQRLFSLPTQCTITGTSEQVSKAKELINRARQGEDITGPAKRAAMLERLLMVMAKHGFTF